MLKNLCTQKKDRIFQFQTKIGVLSHLWAKTHLPLGKNSTLGKFANAEIGLKYYLLIIQIMNKMKPDLYQIIPWLISIAHTTKRCLFDDPLISYLEKYV